MNKKLLTLALIISMPLFLTGCTKVKDKVQNKVSQVKEDTEELFSGDINSLIAKGKNMKCTIEVSDEEEGVLEGTIYVSGKKARSEMKFMSGEEEMDMYSIVDGDYLYTWSTMTDQGIKMKMEDTEMDTPDFDTDEYDEGSIDYKTLKDQFSYKCKPWIVDNSKFNPPSDITFIDQTQMLEDMQQMSEDMEDAMKDMCGMCEYQSTEAEKAECRANLGC